jgi:hypothetical protein
MRGGESIFALFMIGFTAVAVISSVGNGASIGCTAAGRFFGRHREVEQRGVRLDRRVSV